MKIIYGVDVYQSHNSHMENLNESDVNFLSPKVQCKLDRVLKVSVVGVVMRVNGVL